MRQIDTIASGINSKYESWKASRESKKTKWDAYTRLWRCQETADDKTRETERSQVKVPATKEAIDTAHDNIMQMVFGRSPFFDIKGRQLEDDTSAQLIKQYLEYLFYREMFQQKFSIFCREMLIYGTAVGRINVKVDTEKRLSKVPKFVTGISIGSETILEEATVNRPEFEHIPIFDFFISPSATSIDNAEGVVIRSQKRISELRQLERDGVLSGVKRLEGGMELNDDKKRRLHNSGISVSANDGEDTYEVLEYWGWLEESVLKDAGFKGDIDGGGAEVCCVVSKGVVLKLINNPFITNERPFVVGVYQRVPGEFYGMGITEAAEGSQKALDATVRSRLDNKALAINQIFGIDVKRLLPGQNLKIHPGKVFLTDGNVHDAIHQFQVRDVTSGTYQEAAEYERYIQEASGVSKFLGGFPAKRGEMSATESSVISNQSSVRIRAVVKSLEDSVVKEILRWYYQIALQFLDVPEMVRVQTTAGGEILMTISPEEISGDYDFIPMGTTAIATKDTLSKLLQFHQMTSNPIDAQLINRPLLIKTIYELLGFNNADEIITEVPQEQAIAQSQAVPNTPSQPGISMGGIGEELIG